MAGWSPAGSPSDPNSWRYDLAGGWTPPGQATDPGGIQYQADPGMHPGGAQQRQPDWSLLVSPPGTPAPSHLVNYTPATGEMSPPGIQAPQEHHNLSMQPAADPLSAIKTASFPTHNPMDDVYALLEGIQGAHGGAPGAGQGVGAGQAVGVGRSFSAGTESGDPGGGPMGNAYAGYDATQTPAAPAPSGPQGGSSQPASGDPLAGLGDQFPPAGTQVGEPIPTSDGGSIINIADGQGGIRTVKVPADKAAAAPPQKPGVSLTIINGEQVAVDNETGAIVQHYGPAEAKPVGDHWQSAGDGYEINTATGESRRAFTPTPPAGAEGQWSPAGNGYVINSKTGETKQVYDPQKTQPTTAGINGQTAYTYDPTTGTWAFQSIPDDGSLTDVSSGRHHAFVNRQGQVKSTYDFQGDPQFQTMGKDLVEVNPDGTTKVVYTEPTPTPPRWWQDESQKPLDQLATYQSPLGGGQDVGVGGKTRYTGMLDGTEQDPLYGLPPNQIDQFGQAGVGPNGQFTPPPGSDDATWETSRPMPNFRPGTIENYQGYPNGPFDISGQAPGPYGITSPAPRGYGVGADSEPMQPDDDYVGVGASRHGSHNKSKSSHKKTHKSKTSQWTPPPAPVDPGMELPVSDPAAYGQAMGALPMSAPMGLRNTARPAQLATSPYAGGTSGTPGMGGDAGGADGTGGGSLSPGSITPPIDPGQVVGTGHRFGEQVSMEGVHKGTDLQAYEGTPAASPVNGTVVGIKEEPQGLGLRVLIRDQSGNVHSLNHLDSVGVSVGDRVQAGQPVSQVGSSGAGSTGPHLDYRVQRPDGQYANPEPALGQLAQLPRADDGSEPMGAGQGVGVGKSDIAWKRRREKFVRSNGGNREKVMKDWESQHGGREADFNKQFKHSDPKDRPGGVSVNAHDPADAGLFGRPSSYLKTAGHLGLDGNGITPNMQFGQDFGTDASGTASRLPQMPPGYQGGQTAWQNSLPGDPYGGSSGGGTGTSSSSGTSAGGGNAADPTYMDATNQLLYYQNLARYQQDQIKNQARQIANEYKIAQQNNDVSRANAALQAWTNLMGQTAFNNPWLQELSGYAPGYGQPGSPQDMTTLMGQSTLGQAMGGTPTFSQFSNATPFQKSAYRTQSELFGKGWDRTAADLRTSWAQSGGPTSTPNLTQVQAGKMSDLDKINQGMLANTFGQTDSDFWGQQSKNWDAGGASQVNQLA